MRKIYEQDKQPQLIFVGDYVDRGWNSKQVVELVIQLQNEGAVCLRGNHDDVVDWLFNKHSETDLREFLRSGTQLTKDNVGLWWLQNGFYPTLMSYDPGNSFSMQAMLKVVPESHKLFFRNLKMFWENDTHFACHGYLDPMENLRSLTFIKHSAIHDVLWSRFSSYGGNITSPLPVWDKIGVFGHTPVETYGMKNPVYYGNLRLIDTAAFKGKFLTAYQIESDECIMQETDKQDMVQN